MGFGVTDSICICSALMIDWCFAGLHGTVLDLAARLDIAIDVAHAVTYLHMYTGLGSDVKNFVVNWIELNISIKHAGFSLFVVSIASFLL